jgi:hypothetical protein
LGRGPDQDAEQDDRRRAHRELRERLQHLADVHPAHHDGCGEPAERALHRLAGAHGRDQLAPPDGAADEVRADVGRPRQEQRQSGNGGTGRAPDRIGVVAEQVGEAQHAARVGGAEGGDGDGAQGAAADAARPDRDREEAEHRHRPKSRRAGEDAADVRVGSERQRRGERDAERIEGLDAAGASDAKQLPRPDGPRHREERRQPGVARVN